VPDRQDPNRRLTKAERRDEARRQREELQRKMAKRRRGRLWAGVALVLAAALIVGLLVLQPFAGASPQDILATAAAAEKTSGCSQVKTIEPYGGVPADDPNSKDRIHIGGTADFPTAPPLSSYASVPPTSGPHNPTPLHAGVYQTPPPVDQTIHSLEHGAAIIWYDPSATGPALDEIEKFYSQKLASQNVSQDRVIVAPYNYPDQGAAGHLPDGVDMALVSWHRLETCTNVSLPAAFNFTSRYAFPTFDGITYLGESPLAERGAAL
jgi:Protein of unknown function (DUF3105)